MKPGNVLHLYRVRLRARLVQELFAVVGIAAGVALLFASQVASQSLSSSVAQLSHGIVGDASLQLIAREPQGMPEAMLARVRRIAGVRVAAPLLEASANASGPKGTSSVELVGADSSLKALGGALVAHTELEAFAGIGAVLLPAPLAAHLGVTKFGHEVTLELYGRSEHAPLYEQLHARQIGGLVASPIVVAPLFYAQELTGLPGRVSRILVRVAPGSEARVRARLLALAGGRLNVEDTGYDERLFAKAASASNQSTALFAVISALVGFLFAFNAMLLTVPQRRRLIADLRRDGYTPRQRDRGAAARRVRAGPARMSARPCCSGMSSRSTCSTRTRATSARRSPSAPSASSAGSSIAIAVGGGMLAALVAVLSPLRDIVSRDPLAAIAPRDSAGAQRRASARIALRGVLCLAAATAILLAAPEAGDPRDGAADRGCCWRCRGSHWTWPLGLLARLARRLTGAVPHLAAMELGCRAHAGDRRRGDRRHRGVRRRRDPRRARGPAQGPARTPRATRTRSPTCGSRRRAPTTC